MCREFFKAPGQKLQLLLAIYAVGSDAKSSFELCNLALSLLHS